MAVLLRLLGILIIGYAFYLLFKEALKQNKKEEPKVIPQSNEEAPTNSELLHNVQDTLKKIEKDHKEEVDQLNDTIHELEGKIADLKEKYDTGNVD